MQYLSTVDIDTFICLFVHCAFLLVMTTPVQKHLQRISTLAPTETSYDCARSLTSSLLCNAMQQLYICYDNFVCHILEMYVSRRLNESNWFLKRRHACILLWEGSGPIIRLLSHNLTPKFGLGRLSSFSSHHYENFTQIIVINHHNKKLCCRKEAARCFVSV